MRPSGDERREGSGGTVSKGTRAGVFFDHVALAVEDLEEAARALSLVAGAPASPVELVPEQGVRLCFIPLGGAGRLELLQPTGPDTPVGRFLERRGPGIHHVALRVDDLERVTSLLEGEGFRLAQGRSARPAHGGGRAVFLYPSSTAGALIELYEPPGEGV